MAQSKQLTIDGLNGPPNELLLIRNGSQFGLCMNDQKLHSFTFDTTTVIVFHHFTYANRSRSVCLPLPIVSSLPYRLRITLRLVTAKPLLPLLLLLPVRRSPILHSVDQRQRVLAFESVLQLRKLLFQTRKRQ